MRLMMMIANEAYQEQIEAVFSALQCQVTLVASTGAFLEYGEIIYLSGLEAEKATELIQQLRVSLPSKSNREETHMRIYMMDTEQY